MDGWDAALCPSSRLYSAGYPTCLYPEARQAGETPVRGIDCGRPGATAQYGSGLVGHLRAGFSALFIWRATWMERPSSARNPFRSHKGTYSKLGARGRPQELLGSFIAIPFGLGGVFEEVWVIGNNPDAQAFSHDELGQHRARLA